MTRSEKIELIELLEEQRKRQCERSYYEFFLDAWKVLEPEAEFKDAPYIKYLCDRIQHHVEILMDKERDTEIDILNINIPPSMSKSSITSKFLNPWIWLKAPWMKIFTSSHGTTLSNSLAVKSRDIILSTWYQKNWGDRFKLKVDQNTKSQFFNNKTGERMAFSPDKIATGFHCHIWGDDDPMNPKEAASSVKLESAISYNDEVVPSRLLERSLRIMTMQRLHVDDPSGHELRKTEKRIEHICLPAEYDADTVSPKEAKDLYIDGYLHPDRLGPSQLAKKKEDLGTYGYAGQYDQNPVPKGGGKIKSEWFEYCEAKEVPGNIIWDCWVDGAYTKKTENDPTGLMIAGYYPPSRTTYIKHFHCARMEMPEFMKFLQEYCDLHGLAGRSRVYFEPKASGESMKQTANVATNLQAVPIRSKLVNEGKEARCQTASPKIEAGKIVFIRGNWNNGLENHLTLYPKYKHDEGIDLMGYACDQYYKKKSRGVRTR
jgi:predicted phage terminase large subunit-like protein